MSKTRRHLTDELKRKVDRHHIVVWSDPHGEYRDTANQLAPPGVDFEPFKGSWYELRRRAESSYARRDPRLVIYVDANEPAEDPLRELRLSGTEYRARLPTVLRSTLKGEMSAAKVEEIANAATTLTAAEALIETGEGTAPARLIQAFETSDASELILKLANGDLADPALTSEAVSFLETTLGGTFPADLENLPAALARHLVLCELQQTLTTLPTTIATSLGPTTAQQRRHAVQVLSRWKSDTRRLDSFRDAMKRVEAELELTEQLDWKDVLTHLDAVPAYDDLAFAEFSVRFDDGNFAEAENLAKARISNSFWALDGDDTNAMRTRWQVARAAAQLRLLIDGDGNKAGADAAELLRRYAQATHKIDRSHRRLELALLDLDDHQGLETAIRESRAAYESWLDSYLRNFTQSVADGGLTIGGMLEQGQIHADVVAPAAAQHKTAYFLVDALRYELGEELTAGLKRLFPEGSIELQPAAALLPSITPVGMANLCPGAEAGIELRLTDKYNLDVGIGSESIDGVPARVARFRAAYSTVADLTLDELIRSEASELGDRINNADLVLVRSQEIDETGEAGKISAGLQAFSITVRHLQRAVSRLVNQGVTRFVITADHGFISLTRDLGQSRIIEKPGGQGDVHRRAFIGKGGTSGEALLRIPLADIGISTDLDVLVPRGLALISGGGSRGFFHGGCSPQELIVPVVSIEVRAPQGTTLMSVNASITSKITSQVFTAKVMLNADLLSSPIEVRAVPMLRAEPPVEVGVLATAGGAETDAGFVRLEPGHEVTLGFRLSTTLERGQEVELQVFDARTDRRLATSTKPAIVARRLEVDDDFA
jgi:hypothetical protein